MYKSPVNIQEYWDIVNKHWDNIFHIINIYLPTFQNRWIDGTSLDKSLGDYIIELKESRNPRIVRAFNAAWWNIPESIPTNEIPSWTQCYDLCVMEYRLYEDMETDE